MPTICSKPRIYVFGILIVTLAVIIIGRLVSLQLLPNQKRGFDFLQEQADARQVRTINIPSARGTIVDRNDEPLAISVQAVNIYLDPQYFETHNSWLLAKLLQLDPQNLQQKLELFANKRFMLVARGILPNNPIIDEVLKLQGVHKQQAYQRFYPAGEIISTVIGLSNINDIGIDGLELTYNDDLTGSNGSKRVLRDLKNRNIKDLGIKKAPVPGKKLTLSIDIRLQHSAYTSVKKAVVENQAAAGLVIAMDIENGEILAMTNYPSYNPNNRSNLNIKYMRNRIISDLFEPGSTIKPLTLIAALEAGAIKFDDTIDASPGSVTIGNKTIYDPYNYGKMSLGTLIKKSSQVGIVKVSSSLKLSQITNLFQHLGLGIYSGIGFPGEQSGGLPARINSSPIEKATLAFGYGIKINLLQLAKSYAILANGGKNVEATILKNQIYATKGRTLISQDIAKRVTALLKLVSTAGGTAEKAAVVGYEIAGKTGTSRQVTAGKYSEDVHNSLFVGFAPAEQPKIVLAVLINNPNNIEYSGGEVAAPVFAEIMTDALRYFKILPPSITKNITNNKLTNGS